jgi:hypothetical protein
MASTSTVPSPWSEQRAASFSHVTCEIPVAPRPLTIRDLTLGGFEVESPVPLRIGSIHVCRFTVEGRVVHLRARVKETRYRPAGGGHTAGLEFRCLGKSDLTAAEQLRQWAHGLRGLAN